MSLPTAITDGYYRRTAKRHGFSNHTTPQPKTQNKKNVDQYYTSPFPTAEVHEYRWWGNNDALFSAPPQHSKTRTQKKNGDEHVDLTERWYTNHGKNDALFLHTHNASVQDDKKQLVSTHWLAQHSSTIKGHHYRRTFRPTFLVILFFRPVLFCFALFRVSPPWFSFLYF